MVTRVGCKIDGNHVYKLFLSDGDEERGVFFSFSTRSLFRNAEGKFNRCLSYGDDYVSCTWL